MGWYPGGGYILDIPSNNPQAAQEAIDNLWVQPLRFCAKDVTLSDVMKIVLEIQWQHCSTTATTVLPLNLQYNLHEV
jgi:hypothetical protein